MLEDEQSWSSPKLLVGMRKDPAIWKTGLAVSQNITYACNHITLQIYMKVFLCYQKYENLNPLKNWPIYVCGHFAYNLPRPWRLFDAVACWIPTAPALLSFLMEKLTCASQGRVECVYA